MFPMLIALFAVMARAQEKTPLPEPTLDEIAEDLLETQDIVDSMEDKIDRIVEELERQDAEDDTPNDTPTEDTGVLVDPSCSMDEVGPVQEELAHE